jgi:arsenate reductase (thioredoxin)
VRMRWSFEDPAKIKDTEQEKLAKFREVRDLIEKKVIEYVAEQTMPVQ